MADLTNPKVIWLKGILFLVVGMLATGLLFARQVDLRSWLLHGIAVWAFCRAYYFAFYVIENYVDAKFRFAGLIDFARYAFLGKQPDQKGSDVRG